MLPLMHIENAFKIILIKLVIMNYLLKLFFRVKIYQIIILKVPTKFVNIYQYWTYSKVIDRIINIAEEMGINVVKVSPAYTSQQCSSCGAIHKESREGERFKCTACGYEIDADLNAAINIHNKGVIDPSPPKDNF